MNLERALAALVLIVSSSSALAQTQQKFAAECSYQGTGPFIYRLVSDGRDFYFASLYNQANINRAYKSDGRARIEERSYSFSLVSPLSSPHDDTSAIFSRQSGELIVTVKETEGGEKKNRVTRYQCRRMDEVAYGETLKVVTSGYSTGLSVKTARDQDLARKAAEERQAEQVRRNAPNKF
jgi:hypothetical protein